MPMWPAVFGDLFEKMRTLGLIHTLDELAELLREAKNYCVPENYQYWNHCFDDNEGEEWSVTLGWIPPRIFFLELEPPAWYFLDEAPAPPPPAPPSATEEAGAPSAMEEAAAPGAMLLPSPAMTSQFGSEHSDEYEYEYEYEWGECSDEEPCSAEEPSAPSRWEYPCVD